VTAIVAIIATPMMFSHPALAQVFPPPIFLYNAFMVFIVIVVLIGFSRRMRMRRSITRR
jgi:prolipoprotein diacylglyceryltransferase